MTTSAVLRNSSRDTRRARSCRSSRNQRSRGVNSGSLLKTQPSSTRLRTAGSARPSSTPTAAGISSRNRARPVCRYVLVDVIFGGQFERDPHQVQRVHRHPGGIVRLVDATTRRQRGAAVEQTDIVEPEKRPGRCCARRHPCGYPSGEIEHQVVRDAPEKVPISVPASARDRADKPARPPRHAPAG